MQRKRILFVEAGSGILGAELLRGLSFWMEDSGYLLQKGGMIYELRTPMNTMLGMNEMILRESSEKENRGYAKEVADAGAYRFWNHHIGISA